MADLAVHPGGHAGPGGAFWRDQATLSVVALSDEDDSSAGAPITYVIRWVGLKNGASDRIWDATAADRYVVKFDSEHLPPGGSLVQLDYQVLPDCGG